MEPINKKVIQSTNPKNNSTNQVENRFDKNVSANHYNVGGVAVQSIWEAKLSLEELKGLYKGNILKYLCRADHKNGIEDYRKAAQYFTWLLEVCEKIEENKKKDV